MKEAEFMDLEKKILKRIQEIEDSRKIESFTLVLDNHIPIPSPRPRVGKYGTMYAPNGKKNKKLIRDMIMNQIPEDVLNNPLESEVYLNTKFYLPIPENFSKTDREIAERGYIRPIVKPDFDNFIKTYMDALKGIVWVDDAQVVKSVEEKLYSYNPRVCMKIRYIRPILTSVFRQYKKKAKLTVETNLIKTDIKKVERDLEKLYNMLGRLTNDETIKKYELRIKAKKIILKELMCGLNGQTK